MGRYTGPVCRLCRREGRKLFLKGERCYTDKCALERRKALGKHIPPGEPPKKRTRVTGYALHLREKQAVKRFYGVSETQMKKYYEMASRKKGVTGELILQFLERRLDNVVYRLAFAPSRRAARQLVAHGHILVNGRKTDIPSYLVEPGDVIELKEKSRNIPIVKETLDKRANEVPKWLKLDKENFRGEVLNYPQPDDLPKDFRMQLVVEFYSK